MDTAREIEPAANCQRCRGHVEAVRGSTPQPRKVLLVGNSKADRVFLSGSAKLTPVADLLLADPFAFEVSFADSLSTAFAALADRPFDTILLDFDGSSRLGLEACRLLHDIVPEVPIVVLSGLDDERLAIEAVATGAEDYVVKGASLDHLLPRAIRFGIARTRQRCVRSEWPHNLPPDPKAAARVAQLTPRQREVFDLLVRGKALKQIAAQLGIGHQAATKHRARILQRCEVSSNAELVCLMFAAGLTVG
jgi:DNA-binding NarL/FixJ family response regulator